MSKDVPRYVLEPSSHLKIFPLERMCQIKIMNILCRKQQLISVIRNASFPEKFSDALNLTKKEAFRNVEAKAEELLSDIFKVKNCRTLILEMLFPAFYRIIFWKHIYAPTVDDRFLHTFYFTHRGVIDNEKTAIHLLENEMIPVRKRFMIACSLCLDTEIYQMWENMDSNDRNSLHREVFEMWYRIDAEDALSIRKVNNEIYPLLYFWLEKLENPDLEHIEDLKAAIFSAIDVGSISAVKYLFRLLRSEVANGTAIVFHRTGNRDCYDTVEELLTLKVPNFSKSSL
ncbi:hypothetical protein HNY73_005211 [Argiope bruennichi]|uniref:Uncharacterized protein n=1 Tax=Argiope bruennichi TaxID=94029 RepID=A0A8T0FFS6_ARGBR|nr:hypothetical protein HNY73_005211 [Argiope bruennichi]